MEELINRTLDLIGGYREQEGNIMSKEHILDWLNQFDEEDRTFLLTELNHIFASRYISRDEFKNNFRTQLIPHLQNKFSQLSGTNDIIEILLGLKVLSHQSEEKSQAHLIAAFAEVLHEDYGIDLNECGPERPTAFLYLDDILCTGTTIFDGLTKFLDGETIDSEHKNVDLLKEQQTPIFTYFYAIHVSGINNIKKRIEKRYPEDVHFYAIGNTITIDDRRDMQNEATLSFLFPKKDAVEEEIVMATRLEIESKVDEHTDEKNWPRRTGNFYRREGKPQSETLYTNEENRDRFENIILKKSIEIFHRANSPSKTMRPLGNGLQTEKSFGFGTLFFTWRNVPFNTPLVFWYGHDWIPLFKRNHTHHQPEVNIDPFSFFI